MKKYKLVIFDMDGLMFDTENIAGKALQKAALEHGFVISDDLRKELIGGNAARNKALLIERLGDDFPNDEIRLKASAYHHQVIDEKGLDLKEGLIDLVKYLKECDIKIAVASSSHRNVIDKYLAMSNLTNYFDYIISGDRVTHSKPHPEIFLNVCEHFNIDVDDALVLEDSKNGILAASSANIPVICVPDMVYHNQEIFNLTIATVPSLKQVEMLLRGYEISLAIFDMDGLIFDTENQCIEPLIAAHKYYGYNMTKADAFQLIGTSGAIAREILKTIFGENYDYDIVMGYFDSLMIEKVRTEGLDKKVGIIEFLEQLKNQEIPCVIASSSKVAVIKEYLELSNMSDYFTKIIGGDMVAFSKPKPDIFIKACEICNVTPDNAMIFEDSINGIIAANAANINVVCVPDILLHNQDVLKKTIMFTPIISNMNGMVKLK